jgi:hypothetical protein
MFQYFGRLTVHVQRISLVAVGLFGPSLVVHAKPPQWRCEAEAGWLDKVKENIPGAVDGEGIIHVLGEGGDRVVAESKALAKCQKAVGTKYRVVTKCHIVKCNPPFIPHNVPDLRARSPASVPR